MGKTVVILLLASVLALLPAKQVFAAHNSTLPLYCETYTSGLLKIRLCAWDEPTWEEAKVQAVVDAVVAGTKLWNPLWVSVTHVDSGILHPRIAGFYDPGSRVIFISDVKAAPPNYKFYYTLGHELIHAVYDSWHIGWDKQHCRMYQKTSELEPTRVLIRSWNPEAQFENPFASVLACLPN